MLEPVSNIETIIAAKPTNSTSKGRIVVDDVSIVFGKGENDEPRCRKNQA